MQTYFSCEAQPVSAARGNGRCLLEVEARSYFTNDGQSRYRAPLWDLRPGITSCRNEICGLVSVGRPL
jgi:hypothetical protein